MTPPIQAPPPDVRRISGRSLGVGLVGLALCGAGAVSNPAAFFQAYLVGWVFWTGLSTGCLALLMLQHLTGGGWGLVIRRLLEAGARQIPLAAALFLPLLFGLEDLYVWARPEAVAADALLRHKSIYLNVPFFLARTALYFAVWSGLAWIFGRWSDAQDAAGDARAARRLSALSGPGIIVLVLTMTFASVDWLMSLEPHWFSTIYGGLILAGQGLAALGFAIGALHLLTERPPMSDLVGRRHVHDLGKLLLAFTLVWSYFAFSQFLIIWAGNLPEEIPWYLARLKGGWQWPALALVILQFAAPFFLLLSRDLKRDRRRLARVAGLVVLMRLVDVHWMTAPAFHPGSFSLHWMDLAAPIGIGGVWVAAFAREIGRRPLLPIGDPHLAEAIAHGDE